MYTNSVYQYTVAITQVHFGNTTYTSQVKKTMASSSSSESESDSSDDEDKKKSYKPQTPSIKKEVCPIRHAVIHAAKPSTQDVVHLYLAWGQQ